MKIVELSAENVKRLRAVHIEPDGDVVVISGRNGQGKTSVLDSIAMALGGKHAAKGTVRPIRDGEDRAEVVLDLGDIRVTRTWTQSGTQLKVTTPDGAAYSSPQGLLDDLVGRLSFDPLEFSRQKPKDQVQTLLDLVGLDVEQLDAERRQLFEERTETNRTVRDLEAQAASVDVPEDAPDAEVSITDLLAERDAAAAEYDRAAKVTERYTVASDAAADAERAVRLLEEQLANARADWARKLTGLDEALEELGALPDEMPDLEAMSRRIADAETLNVGARRRDERQRLLDRLALYQETAAEQTKAIAAIDRDKADTIAATDMPVEGLGFDDDGVTYQGVPFAQCSSAEQLRVSVAMAMAMNPDIRIIRITDGSLLDDDSMKVIAQLAEAHDHQVWIERVGEDDEIGVVIEDGEVVRVNGAVPA